MPSRRLTAAVAATAADRHYLNVSDWMGGGKDPFGREGGSPRQFLPYYLNGMPLPPSLMTSLPHDRLAFECWRLVLVALVAGG